MKKIIIGLTISAACAVALYSAFKYTRRTQPESGNTYSIAILSPIAHPAILQIEQGFQETITTDTHANYTFTLFNANGNKTLMRAQAEEIVTGNYNLIVTIGAASSQTIAELEHKKNITTPHVFCAVDGRDFAQELTTINKSTTGVYVQTDYLRQMEILRKIKPTAQHVLLVYDPTHGIGLEKDKIAIEQYLQQYGIQLHAVEIYNANEIQQKVAALLPTVDVVLVLIDNTVVAGIDALITLCNRHGVTLFASDLGSGAKGAALAYGITEYESGASAAHKAIEILVDKKNPAALPISAVTTFRVVVNKNTMHTQNVSVTDETMNEINAKESND